MNQELRDRNGKLIGKIKDDYAGKSEIEMVSLKVLMILLQILQEIEMDV